MGRTLISTRCEDYPCCGHGPASTGGDGGGCPKVYEEDDGSIHEHYNCCGCGAELPEGASSALCSCCYRKAARGDDYDYPEDYDNSDEYDNEYDR